MKSKFLYTIVLVINCFCFLLFSCQKETSPVVVDDTPYGLKSAEKNAVTVTSTFEALANFAQIGFNVSGGNEGIFTIGSCPAVTVNYKTPPYYITLDWGTECAGLDGLVRTGKINVSIDGMMSVKENTAIMKIENYLVDGKKISGTTKIISAGPNPGNAWPRYDIVSEGKIEFSDKSVITFKYDGVRLLAEGASTTAINDDLWRTEIHSASGVNQDGSTWTAKSTKVMIKKGDCKWYGSGTYVITPSNGAIRTIDFGDGACNNIATLKIGDGEAKTITLD